MKEQVLTVVLLGLVTSRRLSWIASDWSGAARTKFAQGKKKEHEGKRWSVSPKVGHSSCVGKGTILMGQWQSTRHRETVTVEDQDHIPDARHEEARRVCAACRERCQQHTPIPGDCR